MENEFEDMDPLRNALLNKSIIHIHTVLEKMMPNEYGDTIESFKSDVALGLMSQLICRCIPENEHVFAIDMMCRGIKEQVAANMNIQREKKSNGI